MATDEMELLLADADLGGLVRNAALPGETAMAVRSAAIVLGLVGVPAAMAVCAVLTLFTLLFVVLLAPLVAVALAALVWQVERRSAGRPFEPMAR